MSVFTIPVYLELNGTKFYNYKLYYDYDARYARPGCHPNNIDFAVDIKTLELLKSKQLSNIHPPKGSPIYLGPYCTCLVDDVRRNYTIKRNIDAGDYNVVSPLPSRAMAFAVWYKTLAIFPSKKIIVSSTEFNTQPVDMAKRAEQLVGEELNWDEMIIESFDNWPDFWMIKGGLFYKAILDGNLQKPVVPIDNLDLNSENELTTDVLRLVYETTKHGLFEKDAEKNFFLQMNVLNQHNWREYPGTVSFLVHEIGCRGVCKYYARRSSGPKAVREILDSVQTDFVSEKDFNMCQKFVMELLDLDENAKFVSYSDFVDKLSKIDMPVRSFMRLFNNVVRITPARYEEKAN